MKQGNVLIISMIFIAICIMMILFIGIIFRSHVNSILYNIKLEMYSINKNAVIAVNKNATSIDKFSYNKKDFEKFFIKSLQTSYELDENMKNEDKLITSMKVLDYQIYSKNQKDKFTKQKCDDRVIHTVVEVKMKPIIFPSFFEKIFTFTIHEDVNLNSLVGEKTTVL